RALRGVRGRQSRVWRASPPGEPREDAIERLAERDRLPQNAGGGRRAPEGLAPELSRVVLSDQLRLEREPDQLLVVGEMVDRRPAPPPAGGVGEVQAERAVSEVEGPQLTAAGTDRMSTLPRTDACSARGRPRTRGKSNSTWRHLTFITPWVNVT